MSDDKKQKIGEKPFDRMAYLKEIREGLLVKLGLPKDKLAFSVFAVHTMK